jgi:hypothetical protein
MKCRYCKENDAIIGNYCCAEHKAKYKNEHRKEIALATCMAYIGRKPKSIKGNIDKYRGLRQLEKMKRIEIDKMIEELEILFNPIDIKYTDTKYPHIYPMFSKEYKNLK